MVTESRELALNDREFELFVRGCRDIDCDLRSQESMMIAFAGGRLGLRPGELTHIREEWVDWRRRMIEIPAQQDCRKGKYGGICGACRQSVKQQVEYSQMSLAESRLEVLQEAIGNELPGYLQGQIRTTHVAAIQGDLDEDAMERQLDAMLRTADDVGDRDALLEALDTAAKAHIEDNIVSEEAAVDDAWSPKNENAARKIPFDWDPRAEIVVEEFFDRFDEWPESQGTINRRVDSVLEQVDEWDADRTTPHGLRATGATHLAAKGINPLALQAMFGWADISTARNYVASTPENTKRQLQQLGSR